MLDSETKRHIDNARDILVGKVTDPKSQIDLITIALIYKFMDDMDLEAVDVGGKRSFFVKDLKNLAFSKIMDSKIGAQERMDLYAKVLEKLPFASSIPELFRTIFRDAFLPFRDPQTLTLFLKEIANFSYSNSENLGNAFEYLLSIMGSQGDAGQFRTPRHIIDFIVQVINPKKTESILDPACGTAGFLISAYLHVMKNNKNLSTREIQRFTQGITGYDIDPGMRKLALVNLYLHKFAEPKIFEYDTLTSDEKWNKKFDVIVANPPFMTPKGGIRPHNKFGVQANRSEVLFVDYIAEHLSINGRAGIIVPEGIIFQSSTAYKTLRKMLVEENYLWAVVSLPAGVFQPYAGVKTSILFLDKKIAKSKNEILFVKIENDGFDLGAQRRKIEKNDLPDAITELVAFTQGTKPKANSLIIHKLKLAEDGEYNLTASRYENDKLKIDNGKYEIVKLGDVADFKRGESITKKDIVKGTIPVIAGGQTPAYYHNKSNRNGETIAVSSSGAYSGFISYWSIPVFLSDSFSITPKNQNLNSKFLYFVLKNQQDRIYTLQKGVGIPHIYGKDIENIQIPLPPLEVQLKIVEEIENKQQAIDNARRTIDLLEREREYFGSSLNGMKYKEVKLEDICDKLFAGGDVPQNQWSKEKTAEYKVPIYSNGIEEKSLYGFTNIAKVKEDALTISGRGTIGYVTLRKAPFYPIIRLIVAIPNTNKVHLEYLKFALQSVEIIGNGNTIPQLTVPMIKRIKIPLPSLAEQEKIVAQFNEEQEIIEANKKLIEIMKKKIERVMERII